MQGEDGRVTMEAETEMMLVEAKSAKERQQAPEAGRGKRGSSPGGFRESVTPPAPRSQTSSLQKCEAISFCCLKPPVCGPWSWRPQKMTNITLPPILRLKGKPTTSFFLCPL